MVLILALVSLLRPLNTLIAITSGGIPFFVLFAFEVIFIGGFAAAIIWGRYL